MIQVYILSSIGQPSVWKSWRKLISQGFSWKR